MIRSLFRGVARWADALVPALDSIEIPQHEREKPGGLTRRAKLRTEPLLTVAKKRFDVEGKARSGKGRNDEVRLAAPLTTDFETARARDQRRIRPVEPRDG